MATRGAHVRTVLQMEAAECGAACLTMVLLHHGVPATLQEVRESCAVSRDGIDARRIVTAARRYGLEARGFRRTADEAGDLAVPFVAFWNQNHFVVVEHVGRRSVRVNDPATGRRTVGIEEFARAFSGVALTFAPGAELRRGTVEASRSDVLRLLDLLRGSRRAVLIAVVAGVAQTVPTTVAAVLTAVFAEQVLDGAESSWTAPVLVLAAFVAGLLFALTLSQQRFLLRARLALSVRMTSVFLWRLLRLPVAFFDARSPGALVSRVGLNAQVAGLISGQLASAAISLVAVVCYGVVLLVINPWLGLASVVLASVNIAVLIGVSRARQALNQSLQQSSMQLQGQTFLGISMIDDIVATGSQDEYFGRWAGVQARAMNAQQRLGVLSQRLMLVPVLLTSLNVVLILSLGGLLVIDGHATIPELIAFQVLAASFFAPFSQILGVASLFQNASAWLMQLEDVLEQPLEPGAPPSPGVFTAVEPDDGRASAVEPHQVAGRLELRSVTFGYTRSDPPLLEDVSLTLEPGQWVALVGGSGSGKSTLADVAAGIHRPWSGTVLVDGVDREHLSRHAVARALAKVDQSIMLFSGTVADNIAFFDTSISASAISEAAEDACLAEEIEAKPGGFVHRLSEGGGNLSGGQRQRLEIARALAAGPAILILDEATSALDALTEARIGIRLRRRGCTCLVVAHRLSTIRDCDLILVLDDGRVVERGTHDELMAAGGRYVELVAHE